MDDIVGAIALQDGVVAVSTGELDTGRYQKRKRFPQRLIIKPRRHLNFGLLPTNLGQGMELNVIAAAVIGGANLAGGVGTAFGAVVGAFLIEVIRNSLILLGISTFWQGAFIGSFIIVAVTFDRLRKT